MSHSLVATVQAERGSALRAFRGGRAREEIARHAALVASAREHRLTIDARAGEARHG